MLEIQSPWSVVQPVVLALALAVSLHGGPGRQMAMVRARERKPGRDGGPTAPSKDKALIDGMAFHEHPHPPPHCVPHLQQVTLCETNRSQATAALPGGIFRKVMENMEREKPGFQIFFFGGSKV